MIIQIVKPIWVSPLQHSSISQCWICFHQHSGITALLFQAVLKYRPDIPPITHVLCLGLSIGWDVWKRRSTWGVRRSLDYAERWTWPPYIPPKSKTTVHGTAGPKIPDISVSSREGGHVIKAARVQRLRAQMDSSWYIHTILLGSLISFAHSSENCLWKTSFSEMQFTKLLSAISWALLVIKPCWDCQCDPETIVGYRLSITFSSMASVHFHCVD